MFCSKCGNELPEDSKFCVKCGTSIQFSNSQSSTQIANAAKQVGLDAFETLKLFFSNPIGNLSVSFEKLKSDQIIFVSITFFIVSSLISVFGIKSLIPEYLGFYSPSFFTLLISSLLFPLSVFVISVIVATVIKQKNEYLEELFVASVFSLPIGLFFLLTAIFTLKNMEVIASLLVFMLTFSILILFNGCVKIIKLTERASSISVPIILLISVWLTSVLFRAIVL